MARYEVLLIDRPEGWVPQSPDDVPPEPGPAVETLRQTDELFAAVRRAVVHNEQAQREDRNRWAVVVEPGASGRSRLRVRLCTPLAYKVAATWWPAGWEPQSPLDVPNCTWKAQGDADPKPHSYAQATAIVRGLNEQGMRHVGVMWYVVIAVENEPVLQTISHDASGTETTVEVRRLHVVRPEDGGGAGDCSHCPAGSIDCRRAASTAAEPTLQTIASHKG
jgi:hypothetical protein